MENDFRMTNFNVAQRLNEMARITPDAIAIASPTGSHRQQTRRTYSTTSFVDLDQRSSQIAAGFRSMGMQPGMRIVLLVRFGEDFITLVFALLKAGVQVVLIDPGMGKKNLVRCLEATQPDGFVAIPLAQAIVRCLRHRFPKARLNVTVGNRFGILPSPTLDQLEGGSHGPHQDFDAKQSDPAAIIFTTGSTGPPKGVLYTHGTFFHQVQQLVEHYGIEPGGKDLSGFPLFGLFNAVMGTSTIIPDMNPIRPADVDPPRLLDAIEQWQINQSFGSPALWNAVGMYCEKTGRRVPTLKRVLSAGAPVPPHVLEFVRKAIHPEGTMHTPYGATEALPVASIESRQILGETAEKTKRGLGTCVGNRFSGIEWRVIPIQDGPLSKTSDTSSLPNGTIGELMVSGPVVTSAYVTRTEQNSLHKVEDEDGRIWHRMGDVGYLDDQDRFWFCGRKSHRVRTSRGDLFTEPSEAIFNTHPDVYRSALVGVGSGDVRRPCLIVEPWQEKRPKRGSADESKLIQELINLAKSNEKTESIDLVSVYRKNLPTDIRHNSKIFREQLSDWANRNFTPNKR